MRICRRELTPTHFALILALLLSAGKSVAEKQLPHQTGVASETPIDESNTKHPGSCDKNPLRLQLLSEMGYEFVEMDSLRFALSKDLHSLGCLRIQNRLPPLLPTLTTDFKCLQEKVFCSNPTSKSCASAQRPSLMITGTYSNRGNLMGSIVHNGTLQNLISKDSKVYSRAALAMTSPSGKIVICMPSQLAVSQLNKEALDQSCGLGEKVQELLGGLTLLIWNGRPTCFAGHSKAGACDKSLDVLTVQGFSKDVEHGPLRRALNSMVAIRDGHSYLVWTRADPQAGGYQETKNAHQAIYKSAEEIQKDLCRVGFKSLGKLDGGNSFVTYTPKNPSAQMQYPPMNYLIIHERKN